MADETECDSEQLKNTSYDGESDSALCMDCGNEASTIDQEYSKDGDLERSRSDEVIEKIFTRSTRASAMRGITPYIPSKKGKSRRALVFKKQCYKSPILINIAKTSNCITYNGQTFTSGDIARVIGTDHKVYYCQLQSFLTDVYNEKSAMITWLVPTTHSPPPEQGFDPDTYMYSEEETVPRRMECFEFVMNIPSEYYMSRLRCV